MNRRELNLAIFEGTTDKVLWQPRLETWIRHHIRRDSLPDRFRGMNNLEVYDALGCSFRYLRHVTSCGWALAPTAPWLERFFNRDDLVRIEEIYSDYTLARVRIPEGELCTRWHVIWDRGTQVNRRIEDFSVHTVEDLRVATALVERQQFRANCEAFCRASDLLGVRGEPTIFLSSSGFTELIKSWCGLLGTYYLLQDHCSDVEAFLEACDRRDDRMIDEALKLPCHIYNLGDHATNEFTPPPILKKYLLPRWQRIADRLHAEGRFVHTHWDGNSRHMLPYLRETRLDGVEALTPAPMGDMTLEQIKEAVGDRMIVLDLLPAIDFLPNHPMDELLDFTRRVIDLFAPKLILGVSDEISAPGQIEKIEAISDLIDKVCGLAT